MTIDQGSPLWKYLSHGQKALILQGQFLLDDTRNHPRVETHDYSYIVFPFAKAYEGFLKQLFRDLGFISGRQYNSDHFRVGKVLSPALQKRLGKNSVYHRLVEYQGKQELAENLWRVWKQGRNQIFHYFPHNLHAISLQEAEGIINDMGTVMHAAYTETAPTAMSTGSSS